MMRPVTPRNGNIIRERGRGGTGGAAEESRFCWYLPRREGDGSPMRSEIHLVCCVLAVFSGSPQTGVPIHAFPAGVTSALFPAPAESPPLPEATELPINELPEQTPNPAGRTLTSHLTAAAPTGRTVESDATFTTATSQCTTPSLSAAADTLSSTQTIVSSAPQHATVHSELPDNKILPTFSSRTVHAVQEAGSTSPASTTQRLSAATTSTTAPAQTLVPGWAAVEPTHQEIPPEMNIGDDADLKGAHHRSNSPLDPLLAGLLSVFIVTTAVVFTVLFFKFRQRVNHPEFHRLQDLPMDDLMEDTPLSRYAH